MESNSSSKISFSKIQNWNSQFDQKSKMKMNLFWCRMEEWSMVLLWIMPWPMVALWKLCGAQQMGWWDWHGPLIYAAIDFEKGFSRLASSRFVSLRLVPFVISRLLGRGRIRLVRPELRRLYIIREHWLKLCPVPVKERVQMETIKRMRKKRSGRLVLELLKLWVQNIHLYMRDLFLQSVFLVFLSFYLSVFLLFLLFLLFLSFCPLRQNFCFSFLRFFPLLYLIVSKCSIRMLTIGIYVEIEWAPAAREREDNGHV